MLNKGDYCHTYKHLQAVPHCKPTSLLVKLSQECNILWATTWVQRTKRWKQSQSLPRTHSAKNSTTTAITSQQGRETRLNSKGHKANIKTKHTHKILFDA